MSSWFFHFKVLLKRLGIVLLLYILCRMIFFLFNKSAFPEAGFFDFILFSFYGFRFDLSAIMFTNILFIVLHLLPLPFRTTRWYQLLLKIVFYLFNLPALLLMMGDTAYFPFSQKRSTGDIFTYSRDFFPMLPQYLMDYWYLLLLIFFLIAGIEFLYRKTTPTFPERLKIYYLPEALLLCIAFGLATLGARGGWQSRPLSPIMASNHLPGKYIPIVTNTPFSIIYSFDHAYLEEKNYFSPGEAAQLFSLQRNTHAQGPMRHNNVMIIILESFSQEHMGCYGAEKSATPFIDSLAQKGLLFQNVMANCVRSVEGIPAICASLPQMMEQYFIMSAYQSNKIDGIAKLLKKKNYSSAFFHGGNYGTFFLNSFTHMAGFEKYHSRNEYNNDADYDGHWGISDEPFFQYTAQELNKMPSPFCAALFSLSSHHPYTIPENRKALVAGYDNKILQGVRYSDYALQAFFETVAEMPWYKNTLFVITADHKGHPIAESYYHGNKRYAIPLLFFHPGDTTLSGMSTNLAQQIDILPTVLDYLKYDHPYHAFGESLLREDLEHRYVFYSADDIYRILDERFLLRFSNDQSTHFFDYTRDADLDTNIIGQFPKEMQRLEQKLKAIIQKHNHAMIHNELSYEQQH